MCQMRPQLTIHSTAIALQKGSDKGTCRCDCDTARILNQSCPRRSTLRDCDWRMPKISNCVCRDHDACYSTLDGFDSQNFNICWLANYYWPFEHSELTCGTRWGWPNTEMESRNGGRQQCSTHVSIPSGGTRSKSFEQLLSFPQFPPNLALKHCTTLFSPHHHKKRLLADVKKEQQIISGSACDPPTTTPNRAGCRSWHSTNNLFSNNTSSTTFPTSGTDHFTSLSSITFPSRPPFYIFPTESEPLRSPLRIVPQSWVNSTRWIL